MTKVLLRYAIEVSRKREWSGHGVSAELCDHCAKWQTKACVTQRWLYRTLELSCGEPNGGRGLRTPQIDSVSTLVRQVRAIVNQCLHAPVYQLEYCHTGRFSPGAVCFFRRRSLLLTSCCIWKARPDDL